MKSTMYALLALLTSAASLYGETNRTCEAGSDNGSIVQVHGRLNVYNGGYPNLRIWQIGTHHLFGIYSDPADLRCIRAGSCDEDTKLPSNLEHLNLLDSTVYGDFELRVLEPLKAGHMQAACIVDAKNLVIRGAS
jgi:hypothetical protein